jgi:predicted enzyme related to lactoylglutathione lyase
MTGTSVNPIAYLELQTGDLPHACAFFTRLFGWRAERIRVGVQSYLALDLGDRIDSGDVARDTERPPVAAVCRGRWRRRDRSLAAEEMSCRA